MEKIPIYLIYFNGVECGQKSIGYFTAENASNVTKTFRVVRAIKSTKTENAQNKFHIHPQTIKVPPGKSVNFDLTYLSYVENAYDNYFYDVFESDKLIAHLKVQAKSKGPSLNFTKINLNFYNCHGYKNTVKSIELENTSKCQAKFCFDMDESSGMLKVSQSTGILSPRSKLNLKFTFEAKQPGIYYKQIFCLIQFHNPVMFNVMGLWKPKLKMDPKAITFSFPITDTFSCNYESYMAKLNQKTQVQKSNATLLCKCMTKEEAEIVEESDVQKSEELFLDLSAKTLLSNSHSNQSIENSFNEVKMQTFYIDIGNLSEIHRATSIANLSSFRYFCYQWDHDSENNFQIEPCSGVIEPNRKVYFSIYFTPSTPEILYHIDIDVRIFPYYENSNTKAPKNPCLPLTKTLRIIGNSFSKSSCKWLAQCTVVPKVIQLPSCVPEEAVYGTFSVERRGHLPVAFNIVSSKESNYLIQPPLGYISGSFQLFVVQFKSNKVGVHKEDIKIMYNDTDSNHNILSIATSVEVPEIIFGTNNAYVFEPCFPKSKTTATVGLENPTNLYINYEFIVPEEMYWLRIPIPKGIIQPMSSGKMEIIFEPETACEYLDYLVCSLYSTSFPKFRKTIQIKIEGSCQFGYLVATPRIHDFGKCIYGEEKKIKIHLFNFSPVPLDFHLRVVHQAFPIGNPEKDVKITPRKDHVFGKKFIEFEVAITPHGRDIFHYAVECQILKRHSNEEIPSENFRRIFSFTFEGVLPSIQIIDINVDRGGPLFSPHWIWQMMNINKINAALNSLTPETQIDVKLPEAMVMTGGLTIAWLVETNEHGEVEWKIQKNVLCSCFEESELSFSRVEECSHAKSMTFTPTEFTLAPKKRLILQISISYNTQDECKTQWIFYLPFHRKLMLNAAVVSVPSEEPTFTSTYLLPVFKLQPVFVGDPEPPTQLFWLYNNTHSPSFYAVDKISLGNSTTSKHRILDCINPKGMLPPFSCVPLGFVFRPNQINSSALDVYVSLHKKKKIHVQMKGKGLSNVFRFSEYQMEETIPEKAILYNVEVDLEFNVNLINIKFFQTFSEIKRLFFLRNRSLSQEWAFHWHNFKIDGLIQAQVMPNKGLVKAGEEIPMTLILQSFSRPTFVTFSIPCDVVNYSKLNLYQSSLRYREVTLEKYKDYFTITEKGTFRETPDIPIHERPNPNHIFITVNINIISNLNIDHKLTLKQQWCLRAEEELERNESLIRIDSLLVSPIRQLLEKILWSILKSNSFEKKIKNLNFLYDHNYLQILPETVTQIKKSEWILGIPSKTFIQAYLEETFKLILLKNLTNKY